MTKYLLQEMMVLLNVSVSEIAKVLSVFEDEVRGWLDDEDNLSEKTVVKIVSAIETVHNEAGDYENTKIPNYPLKEMLYECNVTVEHLSSVLGESSQTVNKWLCYKTYPKSLFDKIMIGLSEAVGFIASEGIDTINEEMFNYIHDYLALEADYLESEDNADE